MGDIKSIFQLTLIIHGRVQGIFFREETCKNANKLGLVGWVENLPNGTVRTIAQGERPQLEELLAWSKVGPKLAKVEKVEEDWKELKEFTYKTFGCIFH